MIADWLAFSGETDSISLTAGDNDRFFERTISPD
jgi:hypothetical protein